MALELCGGILIRLAPVKVELSGVGYLWIPIVHRLDQSCFKKDASPNLAFRVQHIVRLYPKPRNTELNMG